MLKSTIFEKFKITDTYISSIRLLKLRTELEIINNSCGDKSIFEYLIGLERKITFDFMFWPLVVSISYFRSERVKIILHMVVFILINGFLETTGICVCFSLDFILTLEGLCYYIINVVYFFIFHYIEFSLVNYYVNDL